MHTVCRSTSTQACQPLGCHHSANHNLSLACTSTPSPEQHPKNHSPPHVQAVEVQGPIRHLSAAVDLRELISQPPNLAAQCANIEVC